MSRFTEVLLVLGVLVTVSVFTSSVTTGDVRPVAAVMSAAWLVTGLACLLVAARRHRDRRTDAP